ncbi:MAG TPA: 2-amino-4-hydroxy-6-hydroxymethyldihydropteridine diphosphokinase [Thermoanaerobaculia bacterium]|nr:2-amino-4-hydroxy-6-hydroxymethyldihydropteridine diphosphokinase [Thermoanaerobaculia bacterium]
MKSPPPTTTAGTTTKTSRKRRNWARKRSRSKKKKSSRPTRSARIAYLGLGSNLGDRRRNLREALRRIESATARPRASSLYRTEPVGYVAQPPFYNAVVEILWPGSARALLALARRIEGDLGRVRTLRNGPRTIDVDLLDLGGVVRRSPDPVLPHPRMARRRFVLAPLAEIAPEWRHPGTGRTARELLASLPARPGARRIGRL